MISEYWTTWIFLNYLFSVFLTLGAFPKYVVCLLQNVSRWPGTYHTAIYTVKMCIKLYYINIMYYKTLNHLFIFSCIHRFRGNGLCKLSINNPVHTIHCAAVTIDRAYTRTWVSCAQAIRLTHRATQFSIFE